MSKQLIKINDFAVFIEMVRAASKLVQSAKFQISQTGCEIYGARPNVARCELTTNAVSSDEVFSFSIENVATFLKIVQSVSEVHAGDFTGLKMTYDTPFIRFDSKKFKTKFSTCNENVISQWITTKLPVDKMTPVFEFTTSSDMIKRLNSHSFMFSDPKNVRVYIETKDDMENNAVFASLGNRITDLNNELTLKLGLVTFGSLAERDNNGLVVSERRAILDLERLNLFNVVQSNDIRCSLMNLNCLISKMSLAGKNGTYFNLLICSSMLKN